MTLKIPTNPFMRCHFNINEICCRALWVDRTWLYVTTDSLMPESWTCLWLTSLISRTRPGHCGWMGPLALSLMGLHVSIDSDDTGTLILTSLTFRTCTGHCGWIRPFCSSQRAANQCRRNYTIDDQGFGASNIFLTTPDMSSQQQTHGIHHSRLWGTGYHDQPSSIYHLMPPSQRNRWRLASLCVIQWLIYFQSDHWTRCRVPVEVTFRHQNQVQTVLPMSMLRLYWYINLHWWLILSLTKH
jgi:hypothetical protein